MLLGLALGALFGLGAGDCLRSCNAVSIANASTNGGITSSAERMADALERIAGILEKRK